MRRIILFTVFWLLVASFAAAATDIAAFVFTTEPQVVAPGTSSAQVTVEARDSAGNPVNGHTVCLEFVSFSPSGDFSTNESWSESFKTLILTLGTNQYRRNLFYKDTSPGTKTISLKAVVRPEGKTCPGMSPEEWNVQWTATQEITISTESQQGSNAEQNIPETSVSEPASSLSSSRPVVIPSIKAEAGADRTIVAGSLVEFKGNALGLNDEPLENARFWWNLGDGNSIEGRAILHTYRIPGAYTVGLHVSSGGYASSDYLTVSAVPNQLEIKGVIFGEDGFILLINRGKTEIDFGGWILQDASGKNFVVPVKTKIAPQAEIALLNSVTNLFKNGGIAVIKYPNGREALRWAYRDSASIADEAEPHSTISPAPADVQRSMLNKDPIAGEGERESKEFANAAKAGQGSPWLFLAFALVLSVVASAGFFLFRIYGKT